MTALAEWIITFLSLAVAGLALFAFRAVRRASRRVDQILADELGHRGAHATYDEEIRAWREAPRG